MTRRKLKKDDTYDTCVILPDLHAPFHSQSALDVVCRVIEDVRPDYVISVGDLLDMASVMGHAKTSEQRKLTLGEELKAACSAIAQIEDAAAPHTLLVLVEGNHENRLDRYIARVAPELAGLITYSNIVAGWEVIPYGGYFEIGKLRITHDVGVCGERAIFAAEKDFNTNVVSGHTHLQRWAVVGNGRGDSHVTASGGWLGDPNHANYVARIKRQRNWSHGFNMGYVLRDSGDVFVVPTPIVNGRCFVGGKVF